jgi:predicted porin
MHGGRKSIAQSVKGGFMKCSWRSLSAVSLLASCLATSASAEEYRYTWGGSGSLSGFWIDQDETPANPLNDFGFAAEGKVWGRASLLTDSGFEYGVRAQLRFQSSEHEFSNDLIRGAPDFVDEVWIYAEFLFGRLAIGLEDGAADSAGIYSPTASEINRIDDPRAYPLQDPLRPSFTPFTPNGAHLRTDLNGSGDAVKLIYYSPRLIGVQLSGSYTPELSRGLNDLFDGADQRDQQSNIWEVGLNYQGSLSSFDIGVYLGYVAGYNERETVGNTVTVLATPLAGGAPVAFTSLPFTPDDLEEYGAGAQVAYEGFKIGGSYRVTNIAGAGGLADQAVAPSLSVGCSTIAGCVLPDSQTTVWGAGVTYETGPWRFGVGYVNLEEELPPFIDVATPRQVTQDAQGWTGAIAYEFDENLLIAGGYQHYDFDGPIGTCTVAGCDTLDADLAYIQTTMSF